MRILVLGGTGAMGVPVVKYCSEIADVYVTSRSPHGNTGSIYYITGNAHSVEFLKNEVFVRKYDIIIDFMTYSTNEFKNQVDLLLNGSDHYVFLSSGRVYADKLYSINERDPRILDVCKDMEYLSTDEYALSKARCEDILTGRPEAMWTIIRPYITYNDQRLQLGVYEKENWLRRFLNHHTIVVPNDILDKRTTLTYGNDVAFRIFKIATCAESIGQIYNVTSPQSITWRELLQIYDENLFEITGSRMKLKYIEDSTELMRVWNKYQIVYDRLYSRQFDNSKQEKICGNTYTDLKTGLKDCLKACINKPVYAERKIFGSYEGWSDRVAGELSSLSSFPGNMKKLKYLRNRFLP